MWIVVYHTFPSLSRGTCVSSGAAAKKLVIVRKVILIALLPL